MGSSRKPQLLRKVWPSWYAVLAADLAASGAGWWAPRITTGCFFFSVICGDYNTRRNEY